MPPAAAAAGEADGARRQLDVARQRGERFERALVRDPAQHHRRAEEREEAVGLPTPAAARLGEVLQADEREEALPRALAHDGRQVRQRGDVGRLVQREQHGRPATARVGPPVGGVAHVAQDPDDERGQLLLLLAGRADVEGVSARGEGHRVEEGRLGRGRARTASGRRRRRPRPSTRCPTARARRSPGAPPGRRWRGRRPPGARPGCAAECFRRAGRSTRARAAGARRPAQRRAKEAR